MKLKEKTQQVLGAIAKKLNPYNLVKFITNCTKPHALAGSLGKTEKSKKEDELFNLEYNQYYQFSWFERKWFKHKLKQIIMNFIYKLFDKSLSTYFIELKFYSIKSNKLDDYNKKHGTEYGGDFIMYLPLLVKVKHVTQAESIMNNIVKTLTKEFGINQFIMMNIDKNPMSKERMLQTIETLNNSFELCMKSKLELLTYDFDGYGITNKDKPLITEIDIKVISVGSVSWINQHDYTVIIQRTINED